LFPLSSRKWLTLDMKIKRGIPVSAGVAIGQAIVLDTEDYRVSTHHIEPNQVEAEVQRLRTALAVAAREARETQQNIAAKVGQQIGDILGAHAQLLESAPLAREAEQLIREQLLAAESAFSRIIARFAKALSGLGPNNPFASRSADLMDIEKRVLAQLLGQRREELRKHPGPLVILAHDLTPSETAGLDPHHVHAFVTEAGGKTSHTAIMAGALEIPAIVGLGPFLDEVTEGNTVIVDGHDGVIILDPDDETLERYEQARDSFRVLERRWSELRNLPAETRDGQRVQLMGNIEFPSEAAHCVDRGADGVGLYRTEFLYVGKKVDPSEDDHLEAYLMVLRALPPGQPVVIRTLDLGADKFTLPSWNVHPERNPFLGVRSIRLCLQNLALFKTQLRAILRASAFGDVRLMFPMIGTLMELRQCKFILNDVREELQEERKDYNPKLPVGTMIEVPSAALIADQLAREVDFFSIGTNDLVQYTLAADRTNEHVAGLYSPADPAVLKLIQQVIAAASRHDIQVNICGEMSGDPIFTLLLLGMGLRQLSLTPVNIPEIKTIIRAVTLADAVRVAEEALRLDTARDVMNYLRDQTRRLVPAVVD
jgi:phosphotransferase system enzyme I (PtsI)